MQSREIKANDLLNIIKHKYKIILLVPILVFIISMGVSFGVLKETYTAKVNVSILNNISSNNIGSNETREDESLNKTKMYQELINTYLTKDAKVTLVKEALENSNLKGNINEIADDLKINPNVYANSVTLIYENRDEEQAIDVVQAIANTMINKVSSKEPNSNIEFQGTLSGSNSLTKKRRILNTLLLTVMAFILSLGFSLVSGMKKLEK